MCCLRNFFLLMILAMPSVAAADVNLINFRITCEGSTSKCLRVTLKGSKDKVYVQNKTSVNLADIESARFVEQQMPEALLKSLIAKGYDPEKLKPAYQVMLKFKDPNKLYEMTKDNEKKKLAIFVRNELVMTAAIAGPIKSETMNLLLPDSTESSTQALVDEINAAIALP